MRLAQVGPFTSALVEFASVVGAGALVGSFVMGAIGLLAGWPRGALEVRVLTDGYVGGVWGAVLAAIDLLVRYLD